MQRNKRLNRGNHKELVEKKQKRNVVTDGWWKEKEESVRRNLSAHE